MMDSERRRRQSKNNELFREILLRLREYDLDEVQLLCTKFLKRYGKSATSSRRYRKSSRYSRRNAADMPELVDSTDPLDETDSLDALDEPDFLDEDPVTES